MRYESRVIIRDDLFYSQPRAHKIIRFLAHIHHHRDHREQKDREEKSGEEFFEYVPVELLHDGWSEWQIVDGKLQIAMASYKLVMCFTLALTDHLF
jgi:hypothetical protein